MTVRAATVDDAPELVGLFDQLGYPSTAAAIAKRLERNAIPDYQAWVFTADDGRIAGFAGGHIQLLYENDDPGAQIMILVVDESHRGRGVGRALVEVFEDWARSAGATRAVVGSGTARVEAHRFYENRGYEESGLRFKKWL